jgi:hypothetical protein
MTNPKFYYVDAPIGSGKSYALVQYLKTTKFPATIGTQTNALSKEHEKNLTNEWLSAKAIFRDEEAADSSEDKSSSKRYKEGCKADFPILIVNQDVAGDCDEDTEFRDLFNDEITNIYQRLQIDGLPIFQKAVAEYFEPVDDLDTEFVRLRQTNKIAEAAEDGWTDNLLRNASDHLKKAFDRLRDPHFAVLVNREDLAAFKLELRGWLSLHVIMMPSRFSHYRTTTFIGANFKDSLLYLLWQKLADFEPHPDIKADYHDIRTKAHLVDLFAFHERDLSSTLIKEISPQLYYDAASDAVSPVIDKQPHIYCLNNEKRGQNHRWSLPNSTRLSPDPRGINEFQGLNIAIHLAALNEHPDTFGFLERFAGITGEQVKIATTFERIYQFIGRTSIRSKFSIERIKIFVGDMSTAMFLQSKIGCARPKLLDIGLEAITAAPKKRGPKKVVRSEEEQREYNRLRKQAHRQKLRNAEISPSI